jgi:hypothetical protein
VYQAKTDVRARSGTISARRLLDRQERADLLPAGADDADGAGDEEQPDARRRGEDEAGGGHQQRADEERAPAPDAIGAGGEEQRDQRVAGERRRQQQPDVRLAQPEGDQVEDEHDRQPAIGEQADAARGEEQAAVASQGHAPWWRGPAAAASANRRVAGLTFKHMFDTSV